MCFGVLCLRFPPSVGERLYLKNEMAILNSWIVRRSQPQAIELMRRLPNTARATSAQSGLIAGELGSELLTDLRAAALTAEFDLFEASKA